MKPKFKIEVYSDGRGEFRFRIISSNGKIVAQGEGYKRKAACLRTVKRLKDHLLYAPVRDI